MSKNLTDDSVFLSYVLRHAPEKINISLDSEGWTDLNQLIANRNTSNSSKQPWTVELVQQIVDSDSKKRYTIADGRIRANQGHSTLSVKMTFKKVVPPTVLFHGTAQDAYKLIQKSGGLTPQNRHHVHLSDSQETAQAVGSRRRREMVLLQVDAKKMLADGHKFFLSENGVYLCETVPIKYITEVR